MSTIRDLCPGYDAGEVLRRVDAFWHFEDGWKPVPVGDLRCGSCGTYNDFQLRHLYYRELHDDSGPHTVRYRCDVSLKCCVCSGVQPNFGIACREENMTAMQDALGMTRAGWREVVGA